MLKTKDEIATLIERNCKKNIAVPSRLRAWGDLLAKRYGIPTAKSSDVLSLRTNIRDESDFFLFCVYDTMEDQPKSIDKLFSESEIKEYSESKFKVKKMRFPLHFDMFEVEAGQQYIGTISAKQLMNLRDAQMIRYNEETQRTLKKRVAGDTEFYEITLDRSAVESIEDFMSRGIYIPTTLTFNLPEDSKFEYDADSHVLTISAAEYLDITDGYHRYIAMSNAYNKDKKFDQHMEFRITSFSKERANQFIWQEDQKTKMRKVDSDSYNQTDSVNKLIQQLNIDSNFLLAGNISRNKGIISFPNLASACNVFFYSERIPKKDEVSHMLETKRCLMNGLNKIVEMDPSLASKSWNYKYLICVIYLIKEDPENLTPDNVKKLYQIVSKDENKYIFNNKLSKNAVTRIGKLWKECE